MRTTILVLVAIAAFAGPVAAQEDSAQRIRATLASARAAGLPVQPLESKVAEGRAKNVPMERIARVVELRAAAMTRAQQVLQGVLADEDVAPEDIAVGADALQAGVDDAVLAQVATTSRGQRRTVAIAALAQLVANGVVPEHALQRVRRALARGNEALMNLPAHAGRPEGVGPPQGVPATGRPPGKGRPPDVGPPGGQPPGGGKPEGGPPGGGG